MAKNKTPPTTPITRGRDEGEDEEDPVDDPDTYETGASVGATVGGYWKVTTDDDAAEAPVTVANTVAFAFRAFDTVTNKLVKFLESTA
jgi:hypothetical protein